MRRSIGHAVAISLSLLCTSLGLGQELGPSRDEGPAPEGGVPAGDPEAVPDLPVEWVGDCWVLDEDVDSDEGTWSTPLACEDHGGVADSFRVHGDVQPTSLRANLDGKSKLARVGCKAMATAGHVASYLHSCDGKPQQARVKIFLSISFAGGRSSLERSSNLPGFPVPKGDYTLESEAQIQAGARHLRLRVLDQRSATANSNVVQFETAPPPFNQPIPVPGAALAIFGTFDLPPLRSQSLELLCTDRVLVEIDNQASGTGVLNGTFFAPVIQACGVRQEFDSIQAHVRALGACAQ